MLTRVPSPDRPKKPTQQRVGTLQLDYKARPSTLHHNEHIPTGDTTISNNAKCAYAWPPCAVAKVHKTAIKDNGRTEVESHIQEAKEEGLTMQQTGIAPESREPRGRVHEKSKRSRDARQAREKTKGNVVW